MLKTLLAITSGIFCSATVAAQDISILPLTGMRYFKQGVWAKSIDVKMNGMFLVSNKIPLMKEAEIVLQQPSGFNADKKKISFPAVEYTLLDQKGNTIITTPNLLLNNETSGFAAKDFKSLSFKFVLTADLVKNNSNVTAKFRIYDLKGKNQLTLEYPITVIIKPGEVLQLSKMTNTIKSPANANLKVSNLKAQVMYFRIDTTIKINAKTAFASIEIMGIQGTSLGGIFDGKEKFWVYDDKLNEIRITDILLKEVGGAMENNDVSYTLKVPFRRKEAPPKGYIVRFRWESADRSEVIDVVVNI